MVVIVVLVFFLVIYGFLFHEDCAAKGAVPRHRRTSTTQRVQSMICEILQTGDLVPTTPRILGDFLEGLDLGFVLEVPFHFVASLLPVIVQAWFRCEKAGVVNVLQLLKDVDARQYIHGDCA